MLAKIAHRQRAVVYWMDAIKHVHTAPTILAASLKQVTTLLTIRRADKSSQLLLLFPMFVFTVLSCRLLPYC